MTATLPTVTAIVAAYDYEGYVERTLDSALDQDYPAELLDVMVVDDGSTDATGAVLDAYAAAHPGRVTVIHQANAGYVQATNVALAHARGDVLAILDADDLWPADKTRRQVEVLLERPEVGLVYSDTEIIDPYDAVTRPSLWRWMAMAPQSGPDCFATIMAAKGNVALASTILFRRSLLDHVAPLPARAQYVDWWITARAAQVSALAWVDGLHVGYRMHGANLTLGATGPRRVRETLKTSEVRRQLLMAGGGATLSPSELLEAYKAFEGAAITAVSQAGSAYVPLPPVSDADRSAAAACAARALQATGEGDFEAALRARVDAVAFDPFDAESRGWIAELAAATAQDPRLLGLLDGARGTVVLAHGDELVAEPGLLRAYAAVISEDDDATLVIAAPGADPELALEQVAGALRAAGLDPEHTPDLLLCTERAHGAAALELERHAVAVLTRRPRRLAPTVAPEAVATLRDRLAVPA